MNFKKIKLQTTVKIPRVVGKRASTKQKEALITYLENHLSFAHFLSDAPKGNEVLKQQWQNLADVLNNLPDDDGGAYKNGVLWRKYWLDLREYTKERISEGTRRKQVCEIEKRIMNIISWTPPEIVESADGECQPGGIKRMKLSPANRIQNGRASDLQKEELIRYFEENPEAIQSLQSTAVDNGGKYRIWIELTHRLNAIDGVMKPSIKWIKYWNDIIAYTKNRAKICIARLGPRYERPPTELERRMLRVVQQEDLLHQWEQCFDAAALKSKKSSKKTLSVEQMNDDTMETLNEDWAEYEELSTAHEEGITFTVDHPADSKTTVTIKTDPELIETAQPYEDISEQTGEIIYLEDSTDGYYDIIPTEDEVAEETTVEHNIPDDELNEIPADYDESSMTTNQKTVVSPIQESAPSSPQPPPQSQPSQSLEEQEQHEVITDDMPLDDEEKPNNQCDWSADPEMQDSDEYSFEENLTNAIYQLSAATQNLATALHSISSLLLKYDRLPKAKRRRYQ